MEKIKIGDKVLLDDNGIVREYTVTKPGMRKSNERLLDNEVYLTSPGTIGFDASIDWIEKNRIAENLNKAIKLVESLTNKKVILSENELGEYNVQEERKKDIKRAFAKVGLRPKSNIESDREDYYYCSFGQGRINTRTFYDVERLIGCRVSFYAESDELKVILNFLEIL